MPRSFVSSNSAVDARGSFCVTLGLIILTMILLKRFYFYLPIDNELAYIGRWLPDLWGAMFVWTHPFVCAFQCCDIRIYWPTTPMNDKHNVTVSLLFGKLCDQKKQNFDLVTSFGLHFRNLNSEWLGSSELQLVCTETNIVTRRSTCSWLHFCECGIS